MLKKLYTIIIFTIVIFFMTGCVSSVTNIANITKNIDVTNMTSMKLPTNLGEIKNFAKDELKKAMGANGGLTQIIVDKVGDPICRIAAEKIPLTSISKNTIIEACKEYAIKGTINYLMGKVNPSENSSNLSKINMATIKSFIKNKINEMIENGDLTDMILEIVGDPICKIVRNKIPVPEKICNLAVEQVIEIAVGKLKSPTDKKDTSVMIANNNKKSKTAIIKSDSNTKGSSTPKADINIPKKYILDDGSIIIDSGNYITFLIPNFKIKKISLGNTVMIDEIEYQNYPFTQKYSWEDAQKYCEDLNSDNGKIWRLPSVKELNKISNIKMYGVVDKDNKDDWTKWLNENKDKQVANKKGYKLFIKSNFLENMPKESYFWSNESSKLNSKLAWLINFVYGGEGLQKKSDTNYFLCVSKP